MAQYDSVAEDYARLIAPKYVPIARLIADRVSVAASQTVVEVACGPGTLTRLVAPDVSTSGAYIACDVSASMVEVARRTVPSTVRLIHADLEAMPLPDCWADVVLCSLGPLQDTRAGMAEAQRLLRPGGRVLLTMWGADYAERRLLAEVRRGLGLGEQLTTSTEAATENTLAAGFENVRLTEVRLPAVHATVGAYVRYRAAFGCPPWVPVALFGRWLDAIACAAESHVDAARRVVLDWAVTVLEASAPTEGVHRAASVPAVPFSV